MLSLSPAPVLPNVNQQLLFHAALDEVNARESWAKWVAVNDLDELDNASVRALPLVFYNLQAQASSENLDGRVKGIYRYWWVRQQQLFNAFSSALTCLKAAGIPVLVFKGAALSHTIYPNAGARSMQDIDACVPLSRLPEAVKLLTNNKWDITIPHYANCTLRHEVTLKLKDKIELDMQRYALEACRWNGFNEKVFGRASTLDVLGHEVLVPSLEDHLLIICSHGMRWSEFPTFQWVYDVTLLLRKVEQEGYNFNWSNFLTLCRHTRLSQPVYEALSYVTGEFDAPIPNGVLSKLAKQRDGLIFQLEYAAKCSPTSFWTHFPIHLALFMRLQRYAGSERVGVREYCRSYWNISTPADLVKFWKNRHSTAKHLEA